MKIARFGTWIMQPCKRAVFTARRFGTDADALYRAKMQQEVHQGPVVTSIPETASEQQIKETPLKDQAFVKKKLTIKEHLIVIWEHLKHGMIEVYHDGKWLAILLHKNHFDEKMYTLYEMKKRRVIVKDQLKFIPYSFFMVVPLAELGLPFYMALFPNSVPQQFLFENQVGDKVKELTKNQVDGYQNLISYLPKFANVIGMDPLKYFRSLTFIEEKEGKEKDRFFYKASDYEAKIYNFLMKENKLKLMEQIKLENLSSFELEQICKILWIDYIPGTRIANLFYTVLFKSPFLLCKFIQKKRGSKTYNMITDNFICRFNFTFDSGVPSLVKKQILLAQIRFHMKHIRTQDRIAGRSKSELENLSQKDLVEIVQQRGIHGITERGQLIEFLTDHWLPLSLREDVPSDFLIWTSILRFKYSDVLV